ncbi:zinc finger protein chinmo isoform X1 [Cotesia glomerata]|nr:zinc finger protein chinmo isoform X1 [Cotesia glomerata]XP_044592574.1 zinc finger protein chinmo isoform X1 [Cotesia glomerata]XP_044592582.1 zinc finger protein chinmo isoform X1 [Cotesia glomerata]XP_044592590.1 zinc finger protein chinmo isoform X1 [Cotesia glomerata]
MDSHQQQFCLKWNSFGSNLATAFSNLFKSESLTDVTLFCEGITFKAHRLILAACSKHFQELFEGMPHSLAGLIVILDGTSAHNMASLLEFMYRGEVHVSQESLSSFLKAAEYLQVKGLSIEHEKLAVAHSHASENNTAMNESGGSNAEILESDAISRVMKTEATSVSSPSPNYSVPNIYSSPNYYESPQKRTRLLRSPSDIYTSGKVSVLRDGSTFRPASAPHPLLLDNHIHQTFTHPSDASSHSYTAPHTPTELERDLEQDQSEGKNNEDLKESVAEDLRIKQEPTMVIDRDSSDKLIEKSSGEVYLGGRGFDTSNYGLVNDHKLNITPFKQSTVSLSHPPTPDLSPAPTTPARWNSKINKAGTVSTPDGKKLKCPFCDRLYGYETNLRAHVRQRHQGIRVSCPFCSRTFTRNNTVRRHIAREHKNEISIKAFQTASHQVTDSLPQ